MSRKPDYRVGALDKAIDEKAIVGAAWINVDGTISIVLNSFVVLTSSKSLLLTLFPSEKEEPFREQQGKLKSTKAASPRLSTKYDDDEVPF